MRATCTLPLIRMRLVAVLVLSLSRECNMCTAFR